MAAIVRTRPKKPKPPLPPQSDPKFARTSRQLNQGAAKVKQHPAPAKKAAEAQAAAKGPPDEKMAGAKANQADAMKQAEPQEPEPDSFEALLLAEIDKLVPETLDEADKFMEGGESEQVKSNVADGIKAQKDSAAGEMEAAAEKPPDPGGVPAKQVTPLPAEPDAPPPPVNGGEAMPSPKPTDEISQEQNKVDAKAALDREKLSEKRLTNARDPRFSAVLKEKAKVEKVADATQAKYRAGERAALSNAVAKAQGDAKQGAAALAAEKNKSGKAVTAQQKAAQQRDEQRRAEVTGRIAAIFDRTKASVERVLRGLESDALSEFDRGASAALSTMSVNSNSEIEKFKEKRYSGAAGKATWVADLFRPAPPEIKEIIDKNLKAFSKQMRGVARTVARKVDAKLKQAQAEIAKGQAEISKYVEGLPKDLKEFGKAAEQKVGSQFDQMKKGIEDRKNGLATKLAERYKAAQDAANKIAEQLEKENAGAFAGFAEAVAGVIKILTEFKDKLMAILRKGADTIDLILDDPIGFLSNLIAAIKAGVSGFVANIWTHLKAGFMKWLFGALGGAGVPIPADLSLPSILKMVLAVLGITYERMRAKAVKLLGPTAVTVIEKLVEYVRTLIAGGPAALWEQIKADLSNLKDMVIGEIQNWLVTTIIKAAVVKLLSMFNPAGAIVQAVMAIYNTVMFLIERASQIMEFVNAVINSVHAIATGAIGGAAAWIERALANAIPIVIGFLAALIGLGGIGRKIKSIIQKVQAKVDAAIDKALARIAAKFKALFGKLTGKGKDAKPDARTDAQRRADLEKGVREATEILRDPKVSGKAAKKRMGAIKSKYKLATLDVIVVPAGNKERDRVRGTNSPPLDGPEVEKPSKMPNETIDFTCKYKEKEKRDEFKRQLKMQQDGVRGMKISEWQANRDKFFATRAAAKARGVKSPEGRDPAGAKKMEEVRARELTKRTGELRKDLETQRITERAAAIAKSNPNLKYDEAVKRAEAEIRAQAAALEAQARAKAEAEFKTLVPLHTVDQIAGGRGTDVEVMGDAQINSVIGASWRSRAAKLEAKVKALPDDIKKEEKMNVTLTMDGASVG
jgi:hypothetical protein